jgi:hypothetical protein
MGRLLQVALALLLLGQGQVLRAADVIDGIVATVNSSAILKSDVDEASRYEAFLDGRQPALASATLDRLIDQELIRQQMGRDYPMPSAADLNERIRSLKQQLPAGQTDAGWREAIARYGLSEAGIVERLRAQLQLDRYIDQRLRPAIHVDSASVQAYYRDTLLPELKKSGVAGEPALRLVRPRIEEILVQQRIGEELTTWLRGLREQSRIRLSAELTLRSGNGAAGDNAERGGK